MSKNKTHRLVTYNTNRIEYYHKYWILRLYSWKISNYYTLPMINNQNVKVVALISKWCISKIL